jgi:hypothetical protein
MEILGKFLIKSCSAKTIYEDPLDKVWLVVKSFTMANPPAAKRVIIDRIQIISL